MKKPIVVLAVVSICAVVSQSAMAQSHLGMRGLGAQVGIVGADNMDASAGFGAMANHGMLTPNIRLMSHVDYWSKSQDGPSGSTATLSDITLGARGEYLFSTSSKFMPFVGTGLGMHFLNAKVEMPGTPDMTDGTTKLGLDFGGGFTTPMNPRTQFRSEMWYGIVSDYNQWSLKVGLEFKLGS